MLHPLAAVKSFLRDHLECIYLRIMNNQIDRPILALAYLHPWIHIDELLHHPSQSQATHLAHLSHLAHAWLKVFNLLQALFLSDLLVWRSALNPKPGESARFLLGERGVEFRSVMGLGILLAERLPVSRVVTRVTRLIGGAERTEGLVAGAGSEGVTACVEIVFSWVTLILSGSLDPFFAIAP